MTLQILQHVDARGLSCPMPIVKTAQAIKTIPSGSLVEVLGDRSRIRQGLRGLVANDRQRHRRAVSGRRRLPLRPASEVRFQP